MINNKILRQNIWINLDKYINIYLNQVKEIGVNNESKCFSA
jgi:small nuclear ribonucleoprotein (snRNP)-like protein